MGTFTVYLIAPVVGAILGGGFYHYLIRPALPALMEEKDSL